MKIIAFPSVSRGAGQSSLIFHLAWMYADLGTPVAVVDFDPQARLTSKFLDTGQLDALWSSSKATRKSGRGRPPRQERRRMPERGRPPKIGWQS